MQDNDLSLAAPPLYNINGLIQKPTPKQKTTETAILRTKASTTPHKAIAALSFGFVFVFFVFFPHPLNRIVPNTSTADTILKDFPTCLLIISTWSQLWSNHFNNRRNFGA